MNWLSIKEVRFNVSVCQKWVAFILYQRIINQHKLVHFG